MDDRAVPAMQVGQRLSRVARPLQRPGEAGLIADLSEHGHFQAT